MSPEKIKLTPAQTECMEIMLEEGFMVAHAGYKPTSALVQNGLARHRLCAFGSNEFTLTDAGIEWLAARSRKLEAE